ncbi:hypothetical protein BH24ACT26_BH24ACT26_22280 [soil metagenome]
MSGAELQTALALLLTAGSFFAGGWILSRLSNPRPLSWELEPDPLRQPTEETHLRLVA